MTGQYSYAITTTLCFCLFRMCAALGWLSAKRFAVDTCGSHRNKRSRHNASCNPQLGSCPSNNLPSRTGLVRRHACAGNQKPRTHRHCYAAAECPAGFDSNQTAHVNPDASRVTRHHLQLQLRPPRPAVSLIRPSSSRARQCRTAPATMTACSGR